ncbi:spore associated protein, SapC [Streptomyces sp. CB02959]|uniref:DUF6082 family protein n=1 Tax=Streptomyces sp. CB02959 TaxID=2020330 RepID=UPI000C270D9E|nr:DUF6082 family protein [Streptomyces sp. CB02959]PJN32291.1 spore associated protein, SapC [Streptomyces sp. CB02959]
MKTSHAVLVLAAVGAVQVAQRERHQNQCNRVAVTQLHHSRIAQLVANPDLAQDWAPKGMDGGEFAQLLSENQQMVVLSLWHRLRLLRGSRLRFVADTLMEREGARRYWEHFGASRAREAEGNRCAQRFTEAMQSAYLAHCAAKPAGV